MQRRHVRDLLAHQSEIGDDFVERLPLLGIADGIFKRDPASAHAHCAQLEAADVQDVEGDQMTLADFAQQIFNGHFAVVQNDWASGGAANAHLVLFRAHRESGKILLYQEGGEFLAIDLREYGEQVGESGVGDPHLLAIQNVVLAIGGERRRECGNSKHPSQTWTQTSA